MKTVALRAKLPLLAVAAFISVLALSVIRVQAAPVTCAAGSAACPYVTARGSDIFAGGWFANVTACGPANYQSPQASGGDNYTGAIMTFANTSRTGAGSDLAAFALGLIEGDTANNYGFVTGPSGYKTLSFANNGTPGSNWGGIFEGSNSNSNCIPDYYGTKRTNITSTVGSVDTGLANGNYQINGNTNFGGGTVAASKNLAFFVNGNLTITGGVNYGPHTASTSPKFVVVVKGNIYIKNTVSRLDGWYIAQPTGTNDGVIWTCTDMNNPDGTPSAGVGIKDTWVRTNCTSPLVVNGALTAKQVNLGRINTAGNPFPAGGSETINYIPEMVMGGAFFNEQNKTSGTIQSLINLPPVF